MFDRDDNNNQKHVFVSQLKSELKKRGYRKKNFYWYYSINDILFCIHVQGSQWDKNNYYVNIGCKTNCNSPNATPNELNWTWRHRCFDESQNQTNISVNSVLSIMDTLFNEYLKIDFELFLKNHSSVRIGERWEVLK